MIVARAAQAPLTRWLFVAVEHDRAGPQVQPVCVGTAVQPIEAAAAAELVRTGASVKQLEHRTPAGFRPVRAAADEIVATSTADHVERILSSPLVPTMVATAPKHLGVAALAAPAGTPASANAASPTIATPMRRRP
jgi:hypothetical protein